MPPQPPRSLRLRRAKLASSVMKVCLTVTLCGHGFDGGGGGGGNCFLLNLENCASLLKNPGYAPEWEG